jgi:ribA/ribD-fused uncharacterized protein
MIASFQGANRFLSNFHPAEVELDGIMYPSSEAAYQAAKTLSAESRKAFVTMSPGEAKRAGKKVVMRPDWDSVKILIMTNLVRDKFTRHEDLKDKLLATGDQELVEGNHWRDYFWGVCKGKGENNLGKILMKVRKELKESLVK